MRRVSHSLHLWQNTSFPYTRTQILLLLLLPPPLHPLLPLLRGKIPHLLTHQPLRGETPHPLTPQPLQLLHRRLPQPLQPLPHPLTLHYRLPQPLQPLPHPLTLQPLRGETPHPLTLQPLNLLHRRFLNLFNLFNFFIVGYLTP